MRLPGRLWPADHGLQPVQPLVGARLLAEAPGRPGRRGRGDEEYRDRQHVHQGPALRVWRKRGARAQAIGRSRGGKTTKIHAFTDFVGRPFALMLTPGNVADVTAAPELLGRMGVGAQGFGDPKDRWKGSGGRARYVLGDKGADPLRRSLRQAGAVPVIPGRSSRKRTVRYDRERYKGRHPIENAFCRLKPVLSLSKGTSGAWPPATTRLF